MPANTPFVLVDGPRFTPLRYGLLSAAQIIDDPDPHWQIGTKFQPDACGRDRTVSAFCIAGAPASGTGPKQITATGAPGSAAEPFTVYAYTNCSPVGWGDNLEDLVARASRHLDAGEGRAVERMFWTGTPDGGAVIHPHLANDADTFAQTDGAAYPVQLGSAASVVTAAAVTPVLALSALEGALAECYGGEGVIHIPGVAVSLLKEKGLLETQGPNLRTCLGHLVAVYSSGNREGPTGAVTGTDVWFYATGAVMARRSPVKPTGYRPADFVGRSDNSTAYVVERTYVFDWDCCHFAAQVDMP